MSFEKSKILNNFNWTLENNLIVKIAPIAFILLTFLMSVLRIPFFDEGYNYLISNLNLSEIFYITRIEGHPFLWYVLQKFFKFLPYPISIQLLNWIISSILIVFVWKKAPFNNLIKLLITFSYPFFLYFGVVARPYGLSALSIFLLCYFYNKKLNRPILYSFLIVFASNTTIMGLIGAFCFGLIFLAEIIQNYNKLDKKAKKASIKALLVLVSGAIFIILQFIYPKIPPARPVEYIEAFKAGVMSFIFAPFSGTIFQIFFKISFLILFYSMIFVLFKKDKKALFFFLSSYIILTFLFLKIYVGSFWHYFFYFIFLISAFWVSFDKIKNVKFLNYAFILFLIFSINPFCYFEKGYSETLDTKYYLKMFNAIAKNEEYKNSKLFCLDWFSSFSGGIVPYLQKENIKIYDVEGFDRTSFDSIVNTSVYKAKPFIGDEFIKYLDKTKNNYLITENYFFTQGFFAKNVKFEENSTKTGKDFIYLGEKYKIFFELKEGYPEIPFYIYKISYSKNIL